MHLVHRDRGVRALGDERACANYQYLAVACWLERAVSTEREERRRREAGSAVEGGVSVRARNGGGQPM